MSMVLSSIDEAKEFVQHWLQDKSPVVAERLRMEPSRASELGVDKASKALRLPPTYTSVLRAVDLSGLSIGYFDFWPGPKPGGDIIKSLTEANSSDLYKLLSLSEKQIAIAGRDGGNLVCVGVADSEHSDRVYYVSASNSESVCPVEISDGFEKFFLICANLYYIFGWNDDPDESMKAFLRYCEEIELGAEALEFWKEYASGYWG